jgi:hypothetical protein
MKKIARLTGIIALIAIIGMMVIGCGGANTNDGKDDTGGNNQEENKPSLVGTWKAGGETTNGLTITATTLQKTGPWGEENPVYTYTLSADNILSVFSPLDTETPAGIANIAWPPNGDTSWFNMTTEVNKGGVFSPFVSYLNTTFTKQ